MSFNNLSQMWSSLIQDQESQRIKDIVVPQLKIIEEEIDQLLFVTIKNCANEHEAQPYFDLLAKIQEALAMLFLKTKLRFLSDWKNL